VKKTILKNLFILAALVSLLTVYGSAQVFSIPGDQTPSDPAAQARLRTQIQAQIEADREWREQHPETKILIDEKTPLLGDQNSNMDGFLEDDITAEVQPLPENQRPKDAGAREDDRRVYDPIRNGGNNAQINENNLDQAMKDLENQAPTPTPSPSPSKDNDHVRGGEKSSGGAGGARPDSGDHSSHSDLIDHGSKGDAHPDR
jgi:hypothetical protein